MSKLTKSEILKRELQRLKKQFLKLLLVPKLILSKLKKTSKRPSGSFQKKSHSRNITNTIIIDIAMDTDTTPHTTMILKRPKKRSPVSRQRSLVSKRELPHSKLRSFSSRKIGNSPLRLQEMNSQLFKEIHWQIGKRISLLLDLIMPPSSKPRKIPLLRKANLPRPPGLVFLLLPEMNLTPKSAL